MEMITLLCAIIAAPVIGGGLGELTNGLIQLAIYAGVAGRCLLSRGRFSFAVAPGAMILGAFCLLTVISSAFSVSIYQSIKQSLLTIAGIATYIIVADRCRSRVWAAAVVWSITLCGFGVCLFSVRQYALSAGGGSRFWAAVLGSGDTMRMFGTFVNPGFFSGFLAIALLVALGAYMAAKSSRVAALAAVSCAFITVSLLLTGTKFGAVAVACGLAVFLVLAIASKALGRRDWIRLGILAVVLIPIVVGLSGPLRHRVAAASAGGSQAHSTEFRMYTWKSTLKMIEASPMLGFGPGTFDIAFPRFAVAGLTKHAHESYLQFGAESGAAAPVLLCAAILLICVAGVRGVARGFSPEKPGGESARESSRLAKHSLPSQGRAGWGLDRLTSDLLDPDQWRLVNAAIIGALVASCTRSLVDSDWFVAGIWIPFWGLAGVLAGQTCPMRSVQFGNKVGRYTIIVAAVLMAALGMLFGYADAVLNIELPASPPTERVARLQSAVRYSPLNPRLHRELGKALYIEDEDRDGALLEMSTAIRLSPQDGAGYYIRGNFYQRLGDCKRAIADLKTALSLNPHSTQTMLRLAECYISVGDNARVESVYRRLIAQENTPYERIKGVPEMVDTSYAVAHSYFAAKYRARNEYVRASNDYLATVARLERWKSNKDYIQVGLISGSISEEDITRNVEMLRAAYLGLADCYDRTGNPQKASESRRSASEVEDNPLN